MKKNQKEKRRQIDAGVDVNVRDSFYGITKHRRMILRRAIEGVIRYWVALPAEEQINFMCQQQQLVDSNAAVKRRISSLIAAEVADEFRQQVDDYGCSIKDAFEAAIRCWINLPAKEQAESIRREK